MSLELRRRRARDSKQARCGASRWLALLCCLSASCSLLFDTQKQQCETDEDCSARGLVGAVCVRELCERAADSDGAAGESSSSREDATRMETVDGEPAASSGGPSGTSSAPASDTPTMSAMQPTAGTGSPSTAGAMSTISNTTSSMGMAQSPAQAGAPAAPSCSGESCCASDADCESGGQCVDKQCVAAVAQCSADAECASQGPEFDGGHCLGSQCRPNPRWRCEAMQSTSTTDQKMLTVLVRDSLSLSPVSMVHIVACSKLDLMCTSPVADATTGSDGQLKITVPANFAGYLQQTERSDYAKAMYFLPTAFPEDGVLEPFPLLTAGAIIDALATSLGASTDPSRGHMMLIAEDCDGMALPGVTFMSPQADDNTVQFYVRDLLPSTSAKETAEIGNGGFLNFPAGTAVLNVDRAEGMLHLTTVTVVVRAGFISVAYMRPMLRVQVR